MNRLSSILTVAVVLVAPALALAEGRSRRSHKIENEFLKKELARLCEENWHLKHAVLAADRAMARKAGAFEHGVDLGAALIEMTAQEAKAVGLGGWDLLKVMAVYRRTSRELKAGDIIYSITSPFKETLSATLANVHRAYLPGDVVKLRIYRDGKAASVSVKVRCQCGKGGECPFYSPFAKLRDNLEALKGRRMPRRRGHFGRVDATGGTGKLKRPAVPVWSDHERSEWAGTFQHNDRVEVEAKMKVGERVMVRVRHLESGTSGWLNSKYLKMDRPAAGAPGPGPAAAPDKPASPATPVMQFDHVIHQPHGEYKNEKIVVWETPARQKRKFMLMPGAAVAVLKRVDGDRYGSPYKMINVRTVDGREGWVPQPNVRKAKDQPAPAKPDKPGKPITWNSAYMLYMQALESYSVAMRQARPEARADIDFQTYLDQRCRTEGYRGWDHYAKRAAEAMGPQRWTQFSRTVSVLMADRLRKLAQELSRRDGK